jgi:hypothetical protein
VVEVAAVFGRDGDKTVRRAKAARVHLAGTTILGLERDE